MWSLSVWGSGSILHWRVNKQFSISGSHVYSYSWLILVNQSAGRNLPPTAASSSIFDISNTQYLPVFLCLLSPLGSIWRAFIGTVKKYLRPSPCPLPPTDALSSPVLHHCKNRPSMTTALWLLHSIRHCGRFPGWVVGSSPVTDSFFCSLYTHTHFCLWLFSSSDFFCVQTNCVKKRVFTAASWVSASSYLEELVNCHQISPANEDLCDWLI